MSDERRTADREIALRFFREVRQRISDHGMIRQLRGERYGLQYVPDSVMECVANHKDPERLRDDLCKMIADASCAIVQEMCLILDGTTALSDHGMIISLTTDMESSISMTTVDLWYDVLGDDFQPIRIVGME